MPAACRTGKSSAPRSVYGVDRWLTNRRRPVAGVTTAKRDHAIKANMPLRPSCPTTEGLRLHVAVVPTPPPGAELAMPQARQLILCIFATTPLGQVHEDSDAVITPLRICFAQPFFVFGCFSIQHFCFRAFFSGRHQKSYIFDMQKGVPRSTRAVGVTRN